MLDGSGWLAGDPMSREPDLRAAIEAAGFRKVGHHEAKLYLSFAEEAALPRAPDAGPPEGPPITLEADPRGADSTINIA